MIYNSTIAKHVDDTLIIHQFNHWTLSYRKRQVTHYSLMLFANSNAKKISALESDLKESLGETISIIEHGLEIISKPKIINVQSVMLVDPHVHFHIIPRYQEKEKDPFWPDIADIKHDMNLTTAQREEQINQLRSQFNHN